MNTGCRRKTINHQVVLAAAAAAFQKNTQPEAAGWQQIVNPLHPQPQRVITDGGLTLGASLRLIMLAVN
jgi:hypothetical protein